MCLFDGVSPRRSEVAGFSLFVCTEPPPLCIYYGRKVTHRTRREVSTCDCIQLLLRRPHSLILCFQSAGSRVHTCGTRRVKVAQFVSTRTQKVCERPKKNLSRPETNQAAAAAAADSNNGARSHPGLKSTARLSSNQTGESESLSEKQRE